MALSEYLYKMPTLALGRRFIQSGIFCTSNKTQVQSSESKKKPVHLYVVQNLQKRGMLTGWSLILIGQQVWWNWWAPGLVTDPGKNKMGSGGERYLISTFGFHTHPHAYVLHTTWTHRYTTHNKHICVHKVKKKVNLTLPASCFSLFNDYRSWVGSVKFSPPLPLQF